MARSKPEPDAQAAPPSEREWKDLYEAALRVKDLAAWDWMEEADVFGVRDPDTDEVGFVSVMGMAGEHYAVSLYLGPEGLYGFWAFEECGPGNSPERLLEIPQLQASFGGREELHEEDRQVIKRLGCRFRGRRDWPLFRSYRPGFAPWFLESHEARFLAAALAQLPDVARRFQENSSLLEPPTDVTYFMRVPHHEDGEIVWRDESVEVPPPEEPAPTLAVDAATLGRLGRTPQSGACLEAELRLIPSPLREGDARPFFPYVLLAVDSASGIPVACDLLQPLPSLRAMRESVPSHFARRLAEINLLPRELVVSDPSLARLLRSLAESLRIDLSLAPELPSLDAAKELLFERAI